MSLIAKTRAFKNVIALSRAISTSRPVKSDHNEDHYYYPDFKHGPTPRTKEEHIAAAKKYYMLPEEYKPYTEDEGLGDYPQLPYISHDQLDPNYPYTDPNFFRDYMEPVHYQVMAITADRLTTEKPRIPYWRMITYVLLYTGIPVGLWVLQYYYPKQNPLGKRQYPYQGEKHYTFDFDFSQEK